MKTLIICASIHHSNTKKIATAMAEVLNADILTTKDINNITDLNDYDLIGIGSGIYYNTFHKNILNLIKRLPDSQHKKAFVFSTSSKGNTSSNNSIESQLKNKGFEIIGSFASKGFNNYGPFKIVGGVANGRPNDEDIQDAKTFAENLMK